MYSRPREFIGNKRNKRRFHGHETRMLFHATLNSLLNCTDETNKPLKVNYCEGQWFRCYKMEY